MKYAEAYALYQESGDASFTNMEDLYNQIRALATNGAYEMCIYVDSKSKYNKIKAQLLDDGYDVEDYNGGGSSILEISWGSQ
jgi:hypothetical protein